MIRQILEAYFFAQVVTEVVIENSEKAIKETGEQIEQTLKNIRHDALEGNPRVEAALEATKREYDQVVYSVKELLSNLLIIIQEYTKLPVSTSNGNGSGTTPKGSTTREKVGKTVR